MDTTAIVNSTADAAFISDDQGCIVAWNDAAGRLFNLRAGEVIGRPCHEVLCGRDVYGNRYCDACCAPLRMVERGEPVHHFELEVCPAGGQAHQVRITVVKIPQAEPPGFCLLHILVPVHEPQATAEAVPIAGASREEEAVALERALTPREIEVLSCMASGSSSQEIANELVVSLTTVRTHIQHILKKLGVHSQIEAVSLAFRSGLI